MNHSCNTRTRIPTFTAKILPLARVLFLHYIPNHTIDRSLSPLILSSPNFPRSLSIVQLVITCILSSIHNCNLQIVCSLDASHRSGLLIWKFLPSMFVYKRGKPQSSWFSLCYTLCVTYSPSAICALYLLQLLTTARRLPITSQEPYKRGTMTDIPLLV
jgi:hypothetical protein